MFFYWQNDSFCTDGVTVIFKNDTSSSSFDINVRVAGVHGEDFNRASSELLSTGM